MGRNIDLNNPAYENPSTGRNIDLNVPADENTSMLNDTVDMSSHDHIQEENILSQEGGFTTNQIDWTELFGSETSIELENNSSGEFDYIDLNEPPSESANNLSGEEEILSHYNDHHEREENASGDQRQSKKYKILTNEQRHAIYLALLRRSANGKLKKYTTREVASFFSVPMRTVQRIWKLSKKNMSDGVTDVSHSKTKNCGRKRIDVDWNQFENLPLTQRKTLRDAAAAMKFSTSVLSKNLKLGVIKRHSNPLKPSLTDDNKKARLKFCLSMLDQNSLPHEPKFMNMYNIVHIDEKWFNLSKGTESYYILANEKEPHRTCKSKNFVTKVMFLAATARPRFDADGNVTFSGKIGIFPFVTKEPAQRSSRNRPAGTLETKAMTSVKRENVKQFLIQKVLPGIREKWPGGNIEVIFIQQDNARTHVDPMDIEFCEAAQEDGFDIRLMCQPPNSPDLNVLDLGFFRALQSLRYKVAVNTIDDLIHAVEQTFENYPVKQLNHIFLTLQLCMREILKVKGSNSYKIPHIGKNALEREKKLPDQIDCDQDLVDEIIQYLN